ncbi:MAG: dockerin type I repeat-containing protein [Patescibacteria group bacterium]|nr:dockerin type I repeat-containing protein [Patescibacteria group bacterium]
MKSVVMVAAIILAAPLFNGFRTYPQVAPTDPPFGNLFTEVYMSNIKVAISLTPADQAAGATLSCQTASQGSGKVITCLKSGGLSGIMPSEAINWPLGQYGQIVSLIHENRCDLNGDLSVNVLDYQLLANIILGKAVCPMASCDINKDSAVNVLDLQLLVNVILGKTPCPSF